MRTGGGHASHGGWLSIKVITQLKTSENSWEHRKTSKIIWYHPENNWRPIIDNLVQFEEDFNSRTKKLVRSGPGWGGDRLSQTRPIPRSPDGENNLLVWIMLKSTIKFTKYRYLWSKNVKIGKYRRYLQGFYRSDAISRWKRNRFHQLAAGS